MPNCQTLWTSRQCGRMFRMWRVELLEQARVRTLVWQMGGRFSKTPARHRCEQPEVRPGPTHGGCERGHIEPERLHSSTASQFGLDLMPAGLSNQEHGLDWTDG